jgi:hypothetical protein
MLKNSSRVRIAICAAAIAAFSVTALKPTPAEAWWAHWGWHAGWGYGWRGGCCWGPRVAVGVAPPVVVVRPPVVYARPPVGVWVPPP